MKSMSVCYVPSEEDISCYSRLMQKGLLIAGIKRSFIPFAVMAVISMLLDLWVFLSLFCFYAAAVLIPVIGMGENLKKDLETQRFYLPVTVDFYEDHIVTIRHRAEDGRKVSERHYRFRDVIGILENDSHFFINTAPFNLIVIPKRAIGEEEDSMLRNFIENLFSDKYQKI